MEKLATEPVAMSEGQRLLARGSTVMLADGAAVQLVFSARVIVRIEDRYGSLDAYIETVKSGIRAKAFGCLAFTLSVILSMSEEDAQDLIDTRRLLEYMDAISDAIVEALPPVQKENPRGNGRKPGRSPGAAISSLRSLPGESNPNASGR